MISKVVLQATSIDSKWRSSRCWGLLWQRHGEHEEHSGSTVCFVHVVDPGCARATTAGTRGCGTCSAKAEPRVGLGGGGGQSCGRPPRSVGTPFPIPTLPLVGAVKKLIGPVCRSPKTAWWSSEPAGVRWHCRLSPGTMSRSPGWAVGWSGHVSPERACGLASAPLGGRGGGWGVGGGVCISPRTGLGLCTTPLAPLPQAGAQALSCGASHLVTIPGWVASSVALTLKGHCVL